MEEEISTSSKFEICLLDLPDEVIQYILRLLPPYNDLKTCMQVCKRLHFNVQSVLNYTQISLNRAISDFNIEWSHNIHQSSGHLITKRYSHSACYHDNSMYIFGGCSFSSTTFNDLWRLDLSTHHWHRLPTSGSYPSPKACASIIPYKFNLILFGGLSQPSPYPLHQSWRVFNELHIFNTTKSSWTVVLPYSHPPPLAFHSVTMHDTFMVVFGGVGENNISSNDVWCLDMETLEWSQMRTSEEKPTPRYGSSQIYIDRYHLLVLGGCGGTHRVYTDAWLLNMTDSELFVWTSVTIGNKDYAAPHIFCHPAVRVNSRYVVTISQNPKLKYPGCTVTTTPEQQPRRRNNMIDDRDVNINGRRGELNLLRRRYPGRDIPSNSAPDRLVAFQCPSAQHSRQRERQLEVIQRYERKLFKARKSVTSSNSSSTNSSRPSSPVKESKMAMFVLDIGRVLDNYIEWQEIKHVPPNSPEPTILYSLVLGRGEVIMFGGMYKDTNSLVGNVEEGELNTDNQVSNRVHFLTVPTVVI